MQFKKIIATVVAAAMMISNISVPVFAAEDRVGYVNVSKAYDSIKATGEDPLGYYVGDDGKIYGWDTLYDVQKEDFKYTNVTISTYEYNQNRTIDLSCGEVRSLYGDWEQEPEYEWFNLRIMIDDSKKLITDVMFQYNVGPNGHDHVDGPGYAYDEKGGQSWYSKKTGGSMKAIKELKPTTALDWNPNNYDGDYLYSKDELKRRAQDKYAKAYVAFSASLAYVTGMEGATLEYFVLINGPKSGNHSGEPSQDKPAQVECKIIYNGIEGAAGVEALPQTFTTNSKAVKLPKLTKVGYKFKNWADANGNKVTKIASKEANDIEITAVWTPNVYTVAYAVDDKQLKKNVILPKKDKIAFNETGKSYPSLDYKTPVAGSEFKGWKVDGSEEIFKAGDPIDMSKIAPASGKKITLKAVIVPVVAPE